MIQKERELPFVLPRAITDPRPTGDAGRWTIQRILPRDETAAPQKAEMVLRHPRKFTANAKLQIYPVVALIHVCNAAELLIGLAGGFRNVMGKLAIQLSKPRRRH